MPLEKIILVDDNHADNLFHKIIIKRAGFDGDVVVFQYAEAALGYLHDVEVGTLTLILLDVNMPRMSGFEFLEAYSASQTLKKVHTIVLMLTTSLNPEDKARAEAHPNVKGFLNKPLRVEDLQEVMNDYFD